MTLLAVSVRPGDFTRATDISVRMDRNVSVAKFGKQFNLPVTGTAGISILFKPHIDTVRIFGIPVPKPGALPQIRLAATPRASFSLRDPSVGQRLFSQLDPAQAAHQFETVKQLAHKQYEQDLLNLPVEIVRSIPFEKFPLWGILVPPLRDLIRNIATGLARTAVNIFKALFRSKLLQTLGTIFTGVLDFARKQFNALGAGLERAVAIIVAGGKPWHEVLAELGNHIAGEVQRAGRSLLKEGKWLLETVYTKSRQLFVETVTKLVKAVAGVWEKGKAQVEQLFQHVVRLLGKAGNALKDFFSKLILGLANGFKNTLGAMARVFVDLFKMAFAALGKAWKLLAGTVGSLLSKMRDKLGVFLEPFFKVFQFAKQQFVNFLKFLGSEELKKRICVWMKENWEKIKAAFPHLPQEIYAIVEFIAMLAGKLGTILQQNIKLIAGLVEWIAALPAFTSDAEELKQLASSGKLLKTSAVEGLFSTLGKHAQSQGKTMAEVAKQLISEDNPIIKLLKKIQDGIDNLLTLFMDGVKSGLDALIAAVEKLYTLATTLDDLIFAGAAGTKPYMIEASYYLAGVKKVHVRGARITNRKPKATSSLTGSKDFTTGILDGGIKLGFLELWGRQAVLEVPEPGVMALEQDVPRHGKQFLKIPLFFPFDFLHSVSLAHRPSFYAIDMRYDLPYGNYANYRVADIDNDGYVRDWEVDAVRRAAGGGPYKVELDCDGDGKVSAEDVQMALDQQELYVNGVMYRRSTAPLGFRMALDENTWLFTTMTSLKDESIPGKLDRRGLLLLCEGQLALPPPLTYPLRFHAETRLYIDRFRELEVVGGLLPAVTPSSRYDLVIRGGATGRDFQAHASFEPPNLMARTWLARLTGYIRGLGTYIAAIKGDLRIQLAYECGSPLAQVLLEWKKRFEKLTDPIALIRKLIEDSDLMRIFKAVVRVAGPVMDLLLDWTDPKHTVKAVLAYIRSRTLGGWIASPDWLEMAGELRALNGIKGNAALEKVVDEALQAVRNRLKHTEEQPVFVSGPVREELQKRFAVASDGAGASQAKLALDIYFKDRGRYLASFEELVATQSQKGRPVWPERVTIAGVGAFQLRDVRVPTWDKALKKPLFQSLLRFGAGSWLYAAPAEGTLYQLEQLPENTLATVEGPRLLVDAQGKGWLFVRTQRARFGWVWIGASCDALAASGSLDSEAVEKSKTGIVQIEASPPNTVDDTAYIEICSRALEGRAAEDKELQSQFAEWKQKLIVEIFGAATFGKDKRPFSEAEARTVFHNLSTMEKRAFWAQFVAERSCEVYLKRFGEEIFKAFVPPLIKGDFGAAWQALLGMLGKIGDFSLEEAMLAADELVPALKDAVSALIGAVTNLVQGAIAVGNAVAGSRGGDSLKRRKKRSEIKKKKHKASFSMPPDVKGYLKCCVQSLKMKIPFKLGWDPDKDNDTLTDDLEQSTSEEMKKSKLEFGETESYQHRRAAEEGKRDTKWGGAIAARFGDDTLTATWSIEGGAGVGAGEEAAEGVAATVTGGIKFFWPKPLIPVKLLFLSKDGLTAFLRFFVRWAYHSLDALNLSVDWFNKGGLGKLDTYLGLLRDHAAFSLFALVDALRDIVSDHSDWVVQVLEGVALELQMEVNAALVGTAIVGVDLSETVSVRGKIPLSTLLFPLMDFLEEGAPEVDTVASVADQIIPRLECVIEDRTCAKVGTFPASLEIESRGKLGKVDISLPPGSPLREKLTGWLKMLARAAIHYKKERSKNVPDALAGVRTMLSALDRTLQRLLMAGAGPADPDWWTASPTVGKLMAKLTGRAFQQAKPIKAVDSQVRHALDALIKSKAVGKPNGSGKVLDAERVGSLFKITLCVGDADKAKLEAAGFKPPTMPTPALQSAVYEVALPIAPEVVNWNHFREGTNKLSGIIAAFGERKTAESFAAKRPVAWLGKQGAAAAKVVWAQDGRFWAWLESDLVPRLEKQSCPLPRLSLQKERLRAAFQRVPAGAVERAEAPLFVGVKATKLEQTWQFVLATAGTREDYRAISEQLAWNAKPSGGAPATAYLAAAEALPDVAAAPAASTPAQPAGSAPAEPAQSAPEAAAPTQPEATAPAQPEAAAPAQPEATAPAQPEDTAPAQPSASPLPLPETTPAQPGATAQVAAPPSPAAPSAPQSTGLPALEPAKPGTESAETQQETEQGASEESPLTEEEQELLEELEELEEAVDEALAETEAEIIEELESFTDDELEALVDEVDSTQEPGVESDVFAEDELDALVEDFDKEQENG